MAIKKSELYSSLWAGCDELRGSMDASQYKDYVLVMLFMKYVSDKQDPLVELQPGTTFYDMLKHRGKSDIGDQINKVIGEFAKNNNLSGIITEADFNDDAKLGSGKEKVDRLTNLLNIFNKEELNFSNNRAEGDDLLGDAYEYLMRHFATESGKSKGQFYTPSEVSRVMAQVIGISQSKSQSETLYDPTCGSGSLLLKAADLAPHGITIYGQENDNATRALAVMNMWLHNFADAEIVQGNTMATPLFTDEQTGELKQFDYAVSNPPFSYKAWMNGIDAQNDVYKRFEGYDNLPPQKNGDFAFMLHLIKSLKSKGRACIVLPLGVLFRGNAEAGIRKKIIQKGYIKAIIGLPPNLFYGTGIAASLIVIDKSGPAAVGTGPVVGTGHALSLRRTEQSAKQRGEQPAKQSAATTAPATEPTPSIFMIDASKGFIKDGNKNRLREQDIHKIVDAFTHQWEIRGYSRRVPIAEIADPKNDYNLNIPRYIDSQEPEDIQDIAAHLLGGIPKRDIEALGHYWQVYPQLKKQLYQPIEGRPEYYQLQVPHEAIKDTIFNHPEFTAFGQQMAALFAQWRNETVAYAQGLNKGLRPKQEIHTIAENLLRHYGGGLPPQVDKYAIYQHLMDYWAETMQDDFYELAADGWAAGNGAKRLEKKTKKGDKEIVKPIPGMEGLEGRLIPPALLVQAYFAAEQAAIEALEAEAATLQAQMEELRNEHGGEDGLLANAMDDKGKINKASLAKALKEAKDALREWEKESPMAMAAEPTLAYGDAEEPTPIDEIAVLNNYKKLLEGEAALQAQLKTAQADLEQRVIAQYPQLGLTEIKTLVIEQKWMAEMERRIGQEMDHISHHLTQRIKELAERYATPLPQLAKEVEALTAKVAGHLQQMNFTW